MTIVAALCERRTGEHRVAITPAAAGRFAKLGIKVIVEAGAGESAGFADGDYSAQGATIESAAAVLDRADILLAVRPPRPSDLAGIRPGARVVGGLAPFLEQARIGAYADLGIEAMALELLPRTTKAQAMDILSSQANLAGYHAITRAATDLNRCLPMMTTAAGQVAAARTFVMGVGVAGLQAIATARRLGSIVSATDVRPEVGEQIQSLGARPIFEEIREGDIVTEASGGYAGAMSESYRQRQARLIDAHLPNQDIVVTTAQVPGRRAPQLICDAQIASMKPGSVIVDLAAESGGNVEGVVAGEAVSRHGVIVIGLVDGAARLAVDASNLFARNCFNFVEAFWRKDEQQVAMPEDDPLIAAVTLTRGGRIVHPRFVDLLAA